MNLLIQEFLKTNSFGDLYEKHKVKSSPSKDGRLISFNYDHIHSNESDKLSCQCRGLILARKDGKSVHDLDGFTFENNKRNISNIIFGKTEVVSYGFDRFFNYNQKDTIDWSDKINIYEKLDGTCIFLYYYNGWYIATRSSPSADIPIEKTVGNENHTFSSLFKKSLKETIGISFEDYVKTLDKDYTYVYELTTPLNRVVVVYNDYRVTLLAARNRKTLLEVDIDSLENLVPKVKKYSFESIHQIVVYVNSLNPIENEGVVIRDSKFNRIKVKNIQYVAYNKASDLYGKSDKAIIQLILSEKEDDIIGVVPEYPSNRISFLKDKLSLFIIGVVSRYNTYLKEVNSYPDSDKNKRKRFAEIVNLNEKYHAPFFDMYSRNSTINDFFNKNCKNGEWNESFIEKLLENI